MKQYKKAIAAFLTGLVSTSVNAENITKSDDNENGSEWVSATRLRRVQPQAGENDTIEIATPKILNIGDSRTVGMFYSENRKAYRNAINTKDANGHQWFAEVGKGLKWFNDNLRTIQEHAQNSNIVVINLGINDLAMSGSSQNTAEKYLAVLNRLAENWHKEGKSVFFSAINPVGAQYTHAQLFNKKIDNFNQAMREGLSSDITFIDTNAFIKDQLKTKDFDAAGLHYVSSVNRSIHAYIESQVLQQWAKTHQKGNFNMQLALEKQNTQNH